MVSYSKVYSGDGGRSNARRAARAAGVDPELVTQHGDGFRFPLPAASAPANTAPKTAAPAKPAKAPATFAPNFRFGTYMGAHSAAESQRKRLGLPNDAFVVVVRHDGSGVSKYAVVPKHKADGYTIATGPAPAPASTKPPRPAKDKAASGKQRGKRNGKTEGGENKLDLVRQMICAEGGAPMKEITARTGWLEHTARARISGIARTHNLTIERQRLMGTTFYIAKPKAA